LIDNLLSDQQLKAVTVQEGRGEREVGILNCEGVGNIVQQIH